MADGSLEDLSVGIACGEVRDNPADASHDPRPDLEKLHSDRGALRLGRFRALQRCVADELHQDISGVSYKQPEPAGQEPVGTQTSRPR